jgi:peptidyl-prolyl cis-trans isomerase SurA
MVVSRLAKTLVALGVAVGLATAAPAHATIVERIVAVVGERPVLLTDLRKRAKPYLVQIYATSKNPAQQAAQESEMFRELLNRIIDERLEEQAADKARISVTAEEIDRGLKQKADQIGLSVKDLLAEARRQGLSEQEYRDEVRRQLLEGKLIQLRVMNRVRVSDEDARNEYARWVKDAGPITEIRLLARRLDPNATSQQIQTEEKLADEISRKGQAGADFCQLIMQYSQDTQTRGTCGSRGPQPVAALLPELKEAAEKLKPMQVSDPIRFGTEALLIVQLVKPPQTPSFEDVKPQMQERAMGGVIDHQRKLWLQELRRGIYIDVRL